MLTEPLQPRHTTKAVPKGQQERSPIFHLQRFSPRLQNAPLSFVFPICFLSHRIHVCYIWCAMDPINIPQSCYHSSTVRIRHGSGSTEIPPESHLFGSAWLRTQPDPVNSTTHQGPAEQRFRPGYLWTGDHHPLETFSETDSHPNCVITLIFHWHELTKMMNL